jgi:hypothetical protein
VQVRGHRVGVGSVVNDNCGARLISLHPPKKYPSNFERLISGFQTSLNRFDLSNCLKSSIILLHLYLYAYSTS